MEIDGALNHDGTTVGFFGVTPVSKPSSTADIKGALAGLGLLTDGGASPLNLDGGALYVGSAYLSGALIHQGSALTFFNGSSSSKQTISGSRNSNAALANLLTALAGYGLVTDSSTA